MAQNNRKCKCGNDKREGDSYCKPCKAAKEAEYRKKHPFRIRINGAKARAKRKNLFFDLTAQQIEHIWTGYCAITDQEMTLQEAELDRVDNSLGYTLDNVAWVIERVNRIKNDGSLEELKQIIRYMERCQ